jgi:hypothetical protein
VEGWSRVHSQGTRVVAVHLIARYLTALRSFEGGLFAVVVTEEQPQVLVCMCSEPLQVWKRSGLSENYTYLPPSVNPALCGTKPQTGKTW